MDCQPVPEDVALVERCLLLNGFDSSLVLLLSSSSVRIKEFFWFGQWTTNFCTNLNFVEKFEQEGLHNV